MQPMLMGCVHVWQQQLAEQAASLLGVQGAPRVTFQASQGAAAASGTAQLGAGSSGQCPPGPKYLGSHG
eukprot:CAMPEP_0202873672 /NCGR_PEP_ID=MMETSP1391-20130828/23720_1 /ASSEMBLY_ACC=CAM_ASM_000867 /TAXON_ID=1034604 /ORGANISM="Chlamydomonas leiostraca, Strain SAG 11-49" /LENGTH=68 /DNA_ID=CAMNT_0049554931 /DNA_START=63 /DNA_END=266 /DNA_ORIENTATION=+